MFGIDVGLAFFAALIWWEIALFAILMIGFGFSLWEESSKGFAVAFMVILFIPWSGAGSLWASLSLIGIIYYLIVFLLAGIGWSFFKWRLLVQKEIEYGKESNLTLKKVKRNIQNKKDYDKIVYWILLWPFSALGYFLNDFIYDLVKRIVDKIYTVYDRITDRMLGNSGLDEVETDEDKDYFNRDR